MFFQSDRGLASILGGLVSWCEKKGEILRPPTKTRNDGFAKSQKIKKLPS
jgi:hypothetical protein